MNKKLIMCSDKEEMDRVCDKFEPAEGTETISYDDHKAEILNLATETKSIDDLPDWIEVRYGKVIGWVNPNFVK